jgi:hypothetical protein
LSRAIRRKCKKFLVWRRCAGTAARFSGATAIRQARRTCAASVPRAFCGSTQRLFSRLSSKRSIFVLHMQNYMQNREGARQSNRAVERAGNLDHSVSGIIMQVDCAWKRNVGVIGTANGSHKAKWTEELQPLLHLAEPHAADQVRKSWVAANGIKVGFCLDPFEDI